MSWLEPRDYGHGNGYCGRRNRTPRFVMFLRFCFPLFLFLMWIAWLTQPGYGQMNADYFGGRFTYIDIFIYYFMFAVSSVWGTFAAILPCWVAVTWVTNRTGSKIPEWQQFLEEGGSPFWDRTMFWPVNPDSDNVRWGGYDGPYYDDNDYDHDHHDGGGNGYDDSPVMPMERRDN